MMQYFIHEIIHLAEKKGDVLQRACFLVSFRIHFTTGSALIGFTTGTALIDFTTGTALIDFTTGTALSG